MRGDHQIKGYGVASFGISELAAWEGLQRAEHAIHELVDRSPSMTERQYVRAILHALDKIDPKTVEETVQGYMELRRAWRLAPYTEQPKEDRKHG